MEHAEKPLFSAYVYTEIVPDCSRATLQGIIRGRVDLESVIHSDGWRGYDGLVDLGYQKHFRVQHSHNEFSNKHSHINGIESFWSYAKTRLVRFRGLQKQTFYLHLKECEFRFNHRQEDIYLLVLKLLRENPLSSQEPNRKSPCDFSQGLDRLAPRDGLEPPT